MTTQEKIKKLESFISYSRDAAHESLYNKPKVTSLDERKEEIKRVLSRLYLDREHEIRMDQMERYYEKEWAKHD